MRAGSLSALKRQAEHCRNCPLWKNATQTVFGEGSRKAKIVLVGEQPGHQEDLAGRPFVGPAGQLLDRALAEAGVDRKDVWVTNAVKHFKWKPRGKIRLHQKPSAGEIDACRPWLLGELEFLKPKTIVLMGATAGRSFTGRPVSVMKSRGLMEVSGIAARVVMTIHPSYLLRIRDREGFESEYERFVNDLKLCLQPST
jgi:uracil-DNA glycosylase family protein